MKYMMRFAFPIILLFAFGASAAANGLTDLGNPHNLQYHTLATNNVHALDPDNGGTTEICVFCHTPHGATPQSILWNRKDIDPSSVSSFALYNSTTLVIKKIPEAQYNTSDPAKYPNGATRMCLSCHDGTNAVGYGIGDLATGDSIAMTVSYLDPSTYSSAIDLRKSHPVSFVYTSQIATKINGDLDPDKAYKEFYDVPPGGPGHAVLDDQSRMQCTTCHDPHDDAKEYLPSDGVPPFWRNTSNGFSPSDYYQNLCDDCHYGNLDGGAASSTLHNNP